MYTKLHNTKYSHIENKYGAANAASHMLRTPITCILGFSQLLNSTNLTTEQKEYVQNIEQSTHQLLSVLDCVIGRIK